MINKSFNSVESMMIVKDSYANLGPKLRTLNI